MRILAVIGVLAVIGFVGMASFMRLVPMRPEIWHVDPSSATALGSPNYVLLVNDDAPVVSGSVQDLAARITEIAQDNGWRMIDGSAESGFVTYVIRSRIIGFPDAISIKLSAVQPEGDAAQTRIEIFSRSRYGYDDLGANEAHVAKLLSPLTS